MHITYPVALLLKRASERPVHLPFMDTTFTHYPSCKPDLQVACLYDARSIIEFCAQGYYRYTVYALVDITHDMDSLTEMEAEDFHYVYTSPGIDPHEDQIASGTPLDANLPVMDARDYGLQILIRQLAGAVNHWKDNIELFEEPFNAHVRYGLDGLWRQH